MRGDRREVDERGVKDLCSPLGVDACTNLKCLRIHSNNYVCQHDTPLLVQHNAILSTIYSPVGASGELKNK